MSNTEAYSPLKGRILFEDNHLLIVNKRPSELVQADKTGDVSLLDEVKNHIRISRNKPGQAFAGLVHRLDRPVSGCVMYAKTSKALSRLTEMVKQRRIQKTYWAVVRHKPPQPQAQIEHYLLKNEKLNKSFPVEASRNGAKLALLDYRILEEGEKFYLLEIHLITGRHHQIRVQLAAVGCPIIGDLKYGDKRSLSGGAIALHARSLQFEHPVSRQFILVQAPTLEQFPWNVFKCADIPNL